MSGKRDGGRRGPSATDLMATRPGASTAALEAVRREVAKVGEAIASRDAAEAGRPDPVTREELDAWGTKVLEGVAEAASARTEPMRREELEETVAGLADRIVAATAPDPNPAAGTGGAAEEIEAATEVDGRTVQEQLRWIVHLLMWKGAPIRQDLEGIRQTANGIDAGCAHAREAQNEDFGAVSGRLDAIERGIGELHGNRGIPFGWIVLGIVAGMALEAWTGPLSRFLAWQGI